jgi:hypothetical protein
MRPVAFLLALFLAVPAHAGKLDLLQYPAAKPDPTLTLANGLFLPGGGWFYVAYHAKDPRAARDAQTYGLAFLAATALTTWIMVNNMTKGDNRGFAVGLAFTFGLRYLDVTGSVKRAMAVRRNADYSSREPAASEPPPEESKTRQQRKSVLPVWLE